MLLLKRTVARGEKGVWRRAQVSVEAEVRLLVVHRYQPGVRKLGTAPCEVEFFGRRGKPVKTMRLISAEKAFAFARKLQGAPGCTVSVC
ncbi:MAG: hypothetical protein VKN13_01090 [Cyanobacteriota bacterium]|nr:hypothetical protein [Cyanobacteriota bacterium]